MRTNQGGPPPLTFAQHVDGVALAEVQVLGALGGVVVERHHLVLDGPVLQRVLGLEGGRLGQSSAGGQVGAGPPPQLTWHQSVARPSSATSCTVTSDPSAPPTGVSA